MTDRNAPLIPLLPAPAGDAARDPFGGAQSGGPRAAAPDFSAPLAPRQSPGFRDFIQRRFTAEEFMGLPFTLLVIGLLMLPLVYSAVAQILGAGGVLALDQSVNRFMASWRTPAGVNVMIWPTYLVGRVMVLSLTLVMMIIYWLLQKKTYIIPMGVSVIGGALSKLLGAALFPRDRAPGAAYTSEQSLSFPSGHAVQALACYGFILYFLWRAGKGSRYPSGRGLILLLGIPLIAAMLFSRVYLTVHFLSDVWIGMLLGCAWLALGISLAEWRLRRAAREGDEVVGCPAKRAIGGLLAAELLLFVFATLRFRALSVSQGVTVAIPATRRGAASPSPAGSSPPAAATLTPAAPAAPG